MRRRIGVLGSALLLVAATASAQTVTPDRYRLQFFPASTPDPLTATPAFETADLSVTAVCNQAPPTDPQPAVVVDPAAWVWTDPVNVTPARVCRANTAVVLSTLPAAGSASMAGYLATVTAYSGTAQSPRTRATNAFSLTNGPPPPPPPAGKFVIGQAVTPTVSDAWVFATPTGAMVGTQLLGAAAGTVTAGPMPRLEGGTTLTMWAVDFPTGADGWVWEDRLISLAGHAPPMGVGIRR